MDKAFIYKSCKLCGEKEVEPSHFWKEHKTKESDYCLEFEPRYSLQTKKRIEFKSREFYFTADFNNKNELKQWIKENPDKALEYSLSIIRNRKEAGKLVYAPSQVEIRTLCSPNILWFEKECSFTDECKKLGLYPKYKYPKKFEGNFTFTPEMIIDTREKSPLAFNSKDKVNCLKYGDYYCENSKWKSVYIERKSLNDFIGTISKNYDRFQREIERALENKSYLFIVVEDSLTNALAFNYLPYISNKVRASPDFVFHRVRELMQKYKNIQFVFAGSRKQVIPLITAIYGAKENPCKLDWQYLIDAKLLKI